MHGNQPYHSVAHGADNDAYQPSQIARLRAGERPRRQSSYRLTHTLTHTDSQTHRSGALLLQQTAVSDRRHIKRVTRLVRSGNILISFTVPARQASKTPSASIDLALAALQTLCLSLSVSTRQYTTRQYTVARRSLVAPPAGSHDDVTRSRDGECHAPAAAVETT